MKIYVIPQVNEIKKWEKLSIDYNLGFEYNDFYDPKLLDNKEKLDQLIEKYKKHIACYFPSIILNDEVIHQNTHYLPFYTYY